jgi:hypothetical protein
MCLYSKIFSALMTDGDASFEVQLHRRYGFANFAQQFNLKWEISKACTIKLFKVVIYRFLE